MIKHKTIHNMLESWGKNKREVPPNNDVLKREILSKVPVNFSRTVSFKRSPFVWLPFAFTAMAVFVLIINAVGYKNNFSASTDVGISNESRMGLVPASDKSTISSTPYYNGGELPISDNREFLKVNYNATLRTRHISDLKNKMETIIRGSGGRIDASNSGDKSGYINFAIPKNELESFKIEIRDLVGARFYNEYTGSQNLLRDKQMIEENQRQTENSLNSSQSERSQIVKNHNQNLSSFQTRINSINLTINALNIEYQSATAVRRAEIVNIINQLQVEINTIQSEIASENKNYQAKINSIDIQIKNMQENLKAIQRQDSTLLNNVATVNGSISLNWISLWEIADAYLPGPLLAWIFFVAAFVAFFWYRYFIRISYDSFDFS